MITARSESKKPTYQYGTFIEFKRPAKSHVKKHKDNKDHLQETSQTSERY